MYSCVKCVQTVVIVCCVKLYIVCKDSSIVCSVQLCKVCKDSRYSVLCKVVRSV